MTSWAKLLALVAILGAAQLFIGLAICRASGRRNSWMPRQRCAGTHRL